MTDRPIIFSAPMIMALLAGKKTQTRRLRWTERTDPGDARLKAWFVSAWDKVKPGDRLWVREAWAHDAPDLDTCRRGVESDGPSHGPYYRATASDFDATTLSWRSSIHMPRWASRLTLTVKDVRVERVQDISEDDARDEGCWSESAILETALNEQVPETAVHPSMVFRRLWNTLHGPGAWERNPEVVRIEFTCERRNIDAAAAP